MHSARVICRAFSTARIVHATKKKHWAEEAGRTTNVDLAFEHFDGLYSSVYGKRWPSMRLGLLCPQKYVAVPNNFSDVERICDKLKGLGAFDLRNLWERGTENLTKTAELNSETERRNQERLDETLESIARTKVAEEMDTLYQNAPKLPGPAVDRGEDKRLIRHVKEANTEFVAPTKLKGTEDFDFESEYFAFYGEHKRESTNDNFFTTKANAPTLKFPFLRPFTFEGGSVTNFPTSSRNKATGLRDWICVNPASIAPIIALDLTPGVNMLDLCAGPGTKSLLALMTLCPATLTANDLESSRLGRVRRLFEEFVGTAQPENVSLIRENAAHFPSTPDFERVLADVPCSSDRVSATVSDNSIFKPRRLRERLGLVKTQKSILLSAFRCLKREPGAVCVYSTCTLSPIENDGAVGAALRETEERDLVVDIEGLWTALVPLQTMNVMTISRTKFGVLVEPNAFVNSGPMFISRILRRPPALLTHQAVE